MFTIRKYFNYGMISPVPTGILADKLFDAMSYERQGIEFMPNREWGIVKLYNPKKGTFPYGLLGIVRQVMDKLGQEYLITYKPKIPEVEIRSEKLREYQKDAVAKLIMNNGGILCLPTGAGKTITIIEYLKLMNKKSLVIVPTLDIKRQWAEHGLPNLDVSTYQNKLLQDQKILETYDIIVFDEVHHVAAKTLYKIAMKTKTDTIMVGCSATLEREDGEDLKITAALGGVVYRLTRTELISDGWIANAEVYYLKPKFENLSQVRFMDYQEEYKTHIVNNEHRNMLIINTALLEWNNGRKVLILVSHIEHGDILMLEALRQVRQLEQIPAFKHIKGKIPEIVFMNGKSKDRNQDMGKYDIIIATPIYDEGYDLPSLDCLILAAGGQSSIKLTQRIGRVLRQKHDGRTSIIYDFIDLPKHLKIHYNKRRALLAEEFEVFEKENI